MGPCVQGIFQLETAPNAATWFRPGPPGPRRQSEEGGWLIPLAVVLRWAAACPVSCVVCAQDVTLCHQLSYIVAVPATTRVFVLTDGHLSSIQSTNLSLLWNLALLSLSRNAIEGVQEEALHGLSKLRTLSLGHNRISSSSLPDHTFSKLRALQVLVLSSNALSSLRGSWFRTTRALTRLLLDGNRISNVTRRSFGGTSLRQLRHLDLSNNFISYVEKDAFQPLPHLQEVDLSRNRLAHMPDVLTPLKHLSLLSLDKNQWSCTCDLHPLARFLRTYVSSSARTLRNAKDLKCHVSTPAVATAESMLRLSEMDCDAQAPNLTVSLKDRRPLLVQQDVALMTVLGFAGAVGLTCTGLVVFNWKLQQGKANEDTSGNLCCRTFDESLCAHEARNCHAMGCCTCHLTQDSELKVMSIVKPRKEKPLLQENSHQAPVASESTVLDRSVRNLKEKESTSSHASVRLLRAGCSGAPGFRAAFSEAGSRHCPKRAGKLRDLQHGEVGSQPPPQPTARTIADISRDTSGRGQAASHAALAREGLGRHFTDESWQLPIGKRDNVLQAHRQRRTVMSSSPKPQEPKGHCAEDILCKHTSKYDDPRGLLKRTMPMPFQPENPLICKYVPYDQLRGYLKNKKPHRRGHLNSDREQIQIDRAVEEFLQGEADRDLPRLSKTKKTPSTKSSSFRDPDLVGRKRVSISHKPSAHWRQQGNLSNHWTAVGLPKGTHLEENKDIREGITDSQAQKKKRPRQSDLKGRRKGEHLRKKLNVHPFRDIRVHPENPSPELLTEHKQMPSRPKKLARSSKPVSSANLPQQSESEGGGNLASSELPLEPAPDQTPKHKRANAAPLSARSCSAGNHSEPSHASGGGTSPWLPPTPWGAEHRDSHPQFSAQQKEDASQLGLEVPSSVPGSGEDAGRSAQIQAQTQRLGDHTNDPYGKDHTSDQNQALQAEDQNPSHEQFGKEDRTLTEKSKLPPPQIVESCVADKESNGIGKEIPPPVPWTQPKSSPALMMTDSSAHRNRREHPEVSAAPGCPTTSSDRGTHNRGALSGHRHPEELQTETGEKEEEEGPGERKTNSRALITERQKSWEDRKRGKHARQEPGSVEETAVAVKQWSVRSSREPTNSEAASS